MDLLKVLTAGVLTLGVALVATILVCLTVRRWFLDRRSPDTLPRVWPWALLGAAAITGLVTAPLVAASRAETRTGWVDTDGDGMLDGFVNGSYDWLDVNGSAFATSWLVGIVISAVVLGAGSWYLTRFRLARPLALAPRGPAAR